MNQIVRRATYFLCAALPACLGVAYASMLGPFVIAAIAGAIGLFAASLVRFPVPQRNYGRIAILLVIGIILATPFGVMFLIGLVADGLTVEEWPSVALAAWLFLGPIICASHFLLTGRRAPNNSFKPRPLRGLGKGS